MEHTTKHHRVSSKKQFLEMISGRYFTLEYGNHKTFRQWSLNKLVAEEYRISHKLREEIEDKVPIFKDAKRLLIFKDHKQATQFIQVNLTWNLPRYKESWKPLIIAMASTDTLLYYGHILMKYWYQAKRAKDEAGKAYFALGQKWMYLYKYCELIRKSITKLPQSYGK